MIQNILVFILSLISTNLLASGFQDTLFSKQWGMKNQGQEILRFTDSNIRQKFIGQAGADINWTNVSSKLGRKVRVAVIDSGVDIHHPDLKGKIWKNPNRCDESKNTPDCFGVNALEIESHFDVSDDIGHGTHVAGIIAAAHNNIGVAGVLKDNVEIMVIKVLSKNTTKFIYNNKYITDFFADGILFAIKNGADVINLSLGWPELVNRKKVKNALKLAAEKNIPIIAAAGNNNKDLPINPCIFNNVICVGAVDNQGKITEFTNFGGLVDILAPGESITSTYPSSLEPAKYIESKILRIHGYEIKKGSSQAAPFVSAIVAALKLENPDISLNEIKARLYKNSKDASLATNKDKYSKFGLIDMKATLSNKVSYFATPNYKKLIEVAFNGETSEFAFDLEINNLLNEISDLKIEIRTEQNTLSFEESEKNIASMKAGASHKLTYKGSIKNQDFDSNVKIFVKLSSKKYDIDQTTSNVIFFSKDISKSPLVKKIKIRADDLKALSKIKTKKRVTPLQQIADVKRISPELEYYRFVRSEDNEKLTFQFLSFNENSEYAKSKTLEISGITRVLSIFKADYNLDGRIDYLVYEINELKRELIFHYFDADMKPLWGASRSKWVLPVSSFEGLPIKNDFEEDFQWIKHRSADFGDILVPLIRKAWELPKEDNSDDFFDELPNRVSTRLYYLEPVTNTKEVSIRVRTIESYNFLENMRNRFNLDFDEDILTDMPFPQSRKEAQAGIVNTNVSAGRGFNRKYFNLRLNSTNDYQANEIFVGVSHIESNNRFIFQRMDTRKPQKIFVAQLKKNQARVQIENQGRFEKPIVVETETWGDLLANFLVGFETDQSLNMIFESRYYIYHIDSHGKKQKLRVYRDSTIPTSTFSEFYSPVKINNNGSLQGGLFIDSTRIFGKRVYSMTERNGVFLRPFSLSYNIPNNCNILNTFEFKQIASSHVVLQCGTKGKLSDFRVFPIAL